MKITSKMHTIKMGFIFNFLKNIMSLNKDKKMRQIIRKEYRKVFDEFKANFKVEDCLKPCPKFMPKFIFNILI